MDPGAGGDAPHFTSNLSVTAKEFYPKGYNPPVVENSYNPQVSGQINDFNFGTRMRYSPIHLSFLLPP